MIVPADDPDRLVKALSYGADAIVVDIAGADDPMSARGVAAAFVASDGVGADVWVRINPGPLGHEDAREVLAAGPALRGLVVARTDSSVQLDALDSVLSTVEAETGRAGRSVAVTASLESASSVMSASVVARAPRVVHLLLGEDTIAADLGLEPSADEHELLWMRSQVVLASAAAGIAPPIASPGPVEPDALRSSTVELRRLGFGARLCVDAEQVALVDAVFRPSRTAR
jgi:citrate lyase subunit beta/citryl-CoA lyase